MTVDILSLAWSSSGRDREALILVNHALKNRGYLVQEGSIFNWRYYLQKYRPRLLLLMSPGGARVNFEVARYAANHDVPVVTLVAEGLIEPNQPVMNWGHNVDRVMYERTNIQWSELARNIIVEAEPSLAPRIKISGGPGFDRYRIYRFMERREFLSKYSEEYDSVVGVAGWNFEEAERIIEDTDPEFLAEHFTAEEIRRAMSRFAQDRVELNQILARVISANRNILFLLKIRPNVFDKNTSEFEGLGRYPNVLEIKDEEAVADCINVADFWMAYESTTCLEAWLLNKQTLCINPSGSDFVLRSAIYTGAPVCESAGDVQEAIDSFYANQGIPGFAQHAKTRQQVIKDCIQWADGKNHMRAAYLIEQVLNDCVDQTGPSLPLFDRQKARLANLVFLGARFFPGLPVFKRFARAHTLFDERQLSELEAKYRPSIEEFDRMNPLTEADLLALEEINGQGHIGGVNN